MSNIKVVSPADNFPYLSNDELALLAKAARHAVSKNAPKLTAHELPKAIELIARLS